MISDRMIEDGTLAIDGERVSVQVRIPWYRALPASCIASAELTIDGTAVDPSSLRWGMNEQEFTFEEMVPLTDEWWFPLDSAVLSGRLPADAAQRLQPASGCDVGVELQLYIPYITTDHGVLRIQERATKTMKGNQA